MTHVVRTGPAHAPPIVVVSGVNFGAFFTVEWLEELVPHFRLIIPDIVGQPNLSAETRPKPSGHVCSLVALVLTQLDLGPVPMIGFSFGGAVILDLASTSPSLISDAALVAGWPPAVVSGACSVNLYQLNPRRRDCRNSSAPHLPEHWYAFFDLLGMSGGPCRRGRSAPINSSTIRSNARHFCEGRLLLPARRRRLRLWPNVHAPDRRKHVPAALGLRDAARAPGFKTPTADVPRDMRSLGATKGLN
jgi:pimeloyl-ACP methyl ester carboxylesterase